MVRHPMATATADCLPLQKNRKSTTSKNRGSDLQPQMLQTAAVRENRDTETELRKVGKDQLRVKSGVKERVGKLIVEC